MLKISIPKPCHEDWEAMIPNEQGRHCNACVKTVIDFTSMSDEEVKHFLLHKKEESVCGRFRTQQLHRITIELPGNIFHIPLPFWKKFLAACLLVFSTTLFSCNTTVNGKPEINAVRTAEPTAVEINIGKPEGVPPPPPVCNILGFTRVKIVYDSVTQGVLEIMPEAPVEPLPDIQVPEQLPIPDSSLKIKTVDTLVTKNPPVADSNNCETKIFY